MAKQYLHVERQEIAQRVDRRVATRGELVNGEIP